MLLSLGHSQYPAGGRRGIRLNCQELVRACRTGRREARCRADSCSHAAFDLSLQSVSPWATQMCDDDDRARTGRRCPT
jgi:hypothetical protein